MEENSLIWAYNYACLSGGLSFVVLHDKGPYFIQFCFSVISSTKISLLQTNLSFDDLVGSISVVAFVVVSRQWHVCLSLIIGHQPHCCHPRLPTGNSHLSQRLFHLTTEQNDLYWDQADYFPAKLSFRLILILFRSYFPETDQSAINIREDGTYHQNRVSFKHLHDYCWNFSILRNITKWKNSSFSDLHSRCS